MNLSSKQVENLPAQPRIIDFDIHGIVAVRLIDPTASDAAAISNLLGPPLTAPNKPPDIIIRFEEKLSIPALNYLDLNSMGYTDEGFYLLSRRSGEVQARIPFEQIGDQCEILCQSGLGSIPLLSEIITFTFLKKNYLPLHGFGVSF